MSLQFERQRTATEKDYDALPEGAPCQLIGGQLVMTPSPSVLHQLLAKKIFLKLVHAVEMEMQKGIVLFAPVDVRLGEEDIFQPDLMVVGNHQREIIQEGSINGAPQLVVEVLSPSTAYYDLRHKNKIYAQKGIEEYWIVDPMESSIEIYQNRDGQFVLFSRAEKTGSVVSAVYEGLQLDLAEIFAESPAL